jgi:pimeloyl-ACP methyl ester carboxylesterase
MATPTLVNIGAHSLALYTHGAQPKDSSTPVVFFVSGVASSALNWAVVLRKLPQNLRAYTYDRSGNRNSDPSPNPPTAETVAEELDLLLKKAPITNPLILVGHSWAGVIINEYIVRAGNSQIAGVVLVDANHETAPLVLDVNDPVLLDLFTGVEPYSGMGLESENVMTEEEWNLFRADEGTDKFKAIEIAEENEYQPSFETLREKGLSAKQPILDTKPVYVIAGTRSRDWQNMYNNSVARGNGTEEKRAHVLEMIRTADEKNEGLMKNFLKLSTKNTLVFAHNSGHFVQLTEPDIVVDGVKWALENL